jgi:hypothetical protein
MIGAATRSLGPVRPKQDALSLMSIGKTYVDKACCFGKEARSSSGEMTGAVGACSPTLTRM